MTTLLFCHGCASPRTLDFAEPNQNLPSKIGLSRTNFPEEDSPIRDAGDSPLRLISGTEGDDPAGLVELESQSVEASAKQNSDPEETEDKLPSNESVDEFPSKGTVNNFLELQEVVASIHATFPLLQAAYFERNLAGGNLTAAQGQFDTKFKASTEDQPLGFYETYRHTAGLSQPLYGGGELFGGYRNGRGEFEPWYLERQTNEGGEFKAGVRVPLLKDREIDARRAELWRATYDQQRAEPEIRAQLILFVWEGSITYWQWVAAGRQYEVGDRLLQLARQRNGQLKRRVELGDLDPPVLQDNLRTIAQREAKLIDLRRKLRQASIKLSLFSRSPEGTPLIPDEVQSFKFPNPVQFDQNQLDSDIEAALEARPELAALDLFEQRIRVDFSEAENDTLPSVDLQIAGSQDFGAPTSSKRDKSQFEMEAGLFVDLPLQRRKGQGKMQAARAKLAQLSRKRQFVEDKIATEIQSAFAALEAAYKRLEKARESARLAEYMADVERRKFDLGDSDLLAVVLREQLAVEAAESEIDALLEYFTASANYDAALARDWPSSP